MTDLRRLDLGWFVRPGTETDDGRARVEPVYAYLVRRPEGLLLFDTGMGAHPEVDAHYRPRRRPLEAALGAAGAAPADVTLVVNCHLHFDHCGGNPLLAGTPVVVQATELAEARATPHYTLPELVDVAGSRYTEVDGETELWPGVWLLPTPGHTAGHQSLAVRATDGTVVLAGQAHDSATDHGRAELARRSAAESGVPYPEWLDRIARLDPRRVVFAHDAAVWMPGLDA